MRVPALPEIRFACWLEYKHARHAVSRATHLVGTDFDACDDVLDRAYQVYALLIVLAALAAIWFAVLDLIADVFSAAGDQFACMIAAVAMFVPLAILVALLPRSLGGAPLRFSHPDFAFLIARPYRLSFVAGVKSLANAVPLAFFAALAGYALGVACASCGLEVDSARCALFAVVLVLASSFSACSAGFLRLSQRAISGKGGSGVLPQMFALACSVAVALLLVLVAVAGISSPWVLMGENPILLPASALCVASYLSVPAAASRADRTKLIEKGSLAADLAQIDARVMAAVFGSASVRAYRRRVKMSARYSRKRPLFALPQTQGASTLVARAFVSMIRQREGWPVLLYWGIAFVPASAAVLSVAGGSIAVMLAWVAALVVFPDGPREMCRVFSEDSRNRLVRGLLPYDTFVLLALDALPAYALTTAASLLTLTIVGVLTGFPGGAWGFAFSILFNAGCAMSCGLDTLRFKSVTGKPLQLSCEVGLAVVALLAAAGALLSGGADALSGACVGALLGCLILARFVRSGREVA